MVYSKGEKVVKFTIILSFSSASSSVFLANSSFSFFINLFCSSDRSNLASSSARFSCNSSIWSTFFREPSSHCFSFSFKRVISSVCEKLTNLYILSKCYAFERDWVLLKGRYFLGGGFNLADGQIYKLNRQICLVPPIISFLKVKQKVIFMIFYGNLFWKFSITANLGAYV